MVLPAEFTALYRLFLRATSAAVLHHGPATRSLRRLYRPTFEDAANAVKRASEVESASKEAEVVKEWLREFDTRINKTLSFLLTSSQSRGLSHRVVSHQFQISRSLYPWSKARLFTKNKRREWHPQLDPNSDEYSVTPPSIYSPGTLKNILRSKEVLEFDIKCSGALGEVVKMAEARDKLVFGKTAFRMRKFKGKKFY